MLQQAGNEAWISDSGASTHVIFSSTGMTNYRKCERLQSAVRAADGRSLKIVGFGDIAVMSQSGESIIPLKLCNVAHVSEICYKLFSTIRLWKGDHGFTGGQGGICRIDTVVEEVDVFFDKCGNLYQNYGSRPKSTGGALIAMNETTDSHSASDTSHVVMTNF